MTVTNEVRPVAMLSADPRNARRHPAHQINQIARSIQKFGFVAPVIIRPDGQIIGGHATVLALKHIGRELADVRVVPGLTESGYVALGLALNKLPEASSWDDAALRAALASIADEDELAGVGFSDKELAKLLAEPEELEVREIETSEVDDEFWISIRGPLGHQAEALKALREALKPFAGVSVEQGTIAIG